MYTYMHIHAYLCIQMELSALVSLSKRKVRRRESEKISPRDRHSGPPRAFSRGVRTWVHVVSPTPEYRPRGQRECGESRSTVLALIKESSTVVGAGNLPRLCESWIPAVCGGEPAGEGFAVPQPRNTRAVVSTPTCRLG